MSLLTDILDRLSGIAALKERVVDLSGQLGEMRKVMVEQQKDIAALQGQLRALIQIQGMVQAQGQAQTQALNQAMAQVTTQALLQAGKPAVGG